MDVVAGGRLECLYDYELRAPSPGTALSNLLQPRMPVIAVAGGGSKRHGQDATMLIIRYLSASRHPQAPAGFAD